MSDPALNSFLHGLKRNIDTHKDHDDRELAIRVLMWLCIAQRPFHPNELLDIFADHPRVSAWLEEKIGKPEPAELTMGDDYTVESFWTDLLSDTVIIIYLDSGPVLKLSYAGGTSVLETQTTILSQLGLSLKESHRSAAMYCMDICAKGTLQLVGECQYVNHPSVLIYAWKCWDTHLSLAGDMSCSGEASAMISGVAADVVALLISINHVLNKPTRVRSTGKHIETIALIQQAQRTMERPLTLLAALVDDRSVFDAVIAVRKAMSDPMATRAAIPHRFPLPMPDQGTVHETSPSSCGNDGPAARDTEKQDCKAADSAGEEADLEGPGALSATRVSKREMLKKQRDQNLPSIGISLGERGSTPIQDQPLLTDTHKRTVQTFAEIARGLRHVCLSLAHPTLYGELLRGLDHEISPMHILAETAELMDKITDYARSEERELDDRSDAEDPFEVLDRTYMPQFNVNLVSHYLSDHYGPGAAFPCDVCKTVRILNTGTVNKPEAISSARWYAAMIMMKLKGLVRPSSGNATANFNCQRFDQATSSFSCLPSRIYMPPRDHLQYLVRLEGGLLNFVFKAVGNRLAQLYNWDREPNFTLLSLDPVTADYSLADVISWTQLRSALLSSGYRAALIQAMAAIVLYHLKRFFAPWLGAFLFRNPMDDFRLAISRPDVLLQETLSFTWTHPSFSFLQRCLFDIVALITMTAVSVNNGRPPVDILSRPTARQDAIMCLAKILCWFYGFVTLEYIFCRGMNTVSLLVSVAKLITGGQGGHLALQAAIQAHWIKVPLVVLMTRHYIYHAFVPVVKGSISSAMRGHASLLCALAAVTGGVMAALQLRWKLGFLWVELSNFSAVVVMIVVVILLLGYEFVRDPLGIADSTAWARKRVEEAQESLNHDELVKRLDIIRRKNGKDQKND
jgi:hypothetical protein